MAFFVDQSKTKSRYLKIFKSKYLVKFLRYAPVAQGELSKKLVFPHMFGYSHVLTTVVKIQHI